MTVVENLGVEADDPTGGGGLYDRLPPRPAPELDRVLDAVERCLARYGIHRTSMTDVAREMGVARTTLYRQVASLEDAMALMSSRRFHRFLDELVALSAQGLTVDTFTQVIVRTVRSVLADPVAQRVLHDEPQRRRPVPDRWVARRGWPGRSSICSLRSCASLWAPA